VPGEAPVVVQNASTQKSLQVGVGILAAAAAIALLYFGRIFFITVIVAAMIAFLLDPLVVFFVKLRLPRGLASFVVCSIALVALYLAGLGLYLQSRQMTDDLPAYGARISDMVDSVATRMEGMENGIYRSVVPRRFQPQTETSPAQPPDNVTRGRKKGTARPIPLPPILPPAVQEVHIQPEPTPIFAYAYTYLAEYYSVLLMASFVPFLVYFLLSWRDHIRARYLLIFEGENRQAAAATWAGLGDMVRAYVIGNFLLGLLLSVASALLFASVKLPYWLLIAPMSGFLSLVPYIGLPLALLPPVVAALPASKEPAMYLFLTVSVALLHLLALNLLYPKFVGARVHLNPLVVTVALMFWGMLWGALGLVLAIPLTAAIKALCDHVPSMQPYGRLLGD